MLTSANMLAVTQRVLIAGAIALCIAGTTHAATYGISKFLSGGGGGTDPAKRRIATSMGAYICVDVSPNRDPSTNSVLITFWSLIPQPNSRIRNIAIDTGRHAGLFGNVSVLMQSPGGTAKVGSPQAHAFLPTLKPDYWIDIPSPGGIAPGEMVVLSASLGSGKTYSDVINALNEGLKPATSVRGLRIGVIANSLLGGPPPGVATISDDGGFVVSAGSSRCKGR